MAAGQEGPGLRPRRLLAVTNFWPPMAGGTGYALRGMIGGGTDTTVLVPRVRGLENTGSVQLVPALRFSGRAGGPLKLFSALQHLEIVLAPLLWSLKPGRKRPALLVCVQPLFTGVGGLLLERLLGVPFVVLVHGEELTTVHGFRSAFQLRRRLLAATLHSASAVICNAEHTRALVTRLYGVPQERLRVIHPALPPDSQPVVAPSEAAATRRRLVGDRRMVLMVGRLSQVHKGFDTAIRALPEILRAAPDTALLIAGPGDPDDLAELGRSGGVAEHVVFAGPVPRDELRRLFAACDLFLLPGRELEGTAEGFGVVYLEAALAGKAVVGGRSGGIREAVVDGETGLLVDGADAGAVARAVTRMLCEPGLAERLGRRGRERVLREFDGRKQQQQFATLVDEVLGRKRDET